MVSLMFLTKITHLYKIHVLLIDHAIIGSHGAPVGDLFSCFFHRFTENKGQISPVIPALLRYCLDYGLDQTKVTKVKSGWLVPLTFDFVLIPIFLCCDCKSRV